MRASKLIFLTFLGFLSFFDFARAQGDPLSQINFGDAEQFSTAAVQRVRDRVAAAGTVDPTWKSEEIRRLEKAASQDYYAAAFLYALSGSPGHLATAREFLLKYGEQGGDLRKRAIEALQNPDFFTGGQPWLGDVYYQLNIKPLLAYAWTYHGLTHQERLKIVRGIETSALFRLKAMDRWNHTANLVFKPTYMVAVAGLVTGNQQLLDWGFFRKPGSTTGGYFSVLGVSLFPSGPWLEAPLYPVAHSTLELMAQMSGLLNISDQGGSHNWFAHAVPGGGSPQGLMDYYLDTTYPLELTGHGSGQFRVATYGDGATGPGGDVFLVNPAGPGYNMQTQLALAHDLSWEEKYAAFLHFAQDYSPNIINNWPLPETPAWPAAPSKVWEDFGIAMLRSDESPNYWFSQEAIAVFQMMTRDYGHGHADKLGIMLHGAGRLLYPDYNAVQYENAAEGWTGTSVAHNTLVVDKEEMGREAMRSATPISTRHAFSPEVKFLATKTDQLYPGVEQARFLFLTREYLLDLFHADSATPRTYDYLLHSLGRAQPVQAESFTETDAFKGRYWKVTDTRGMNTDHFWQLDFVLDEQATRAKEAKDIALRPASEKQYRYGPEWYAHRAAVRVGMAAVPDTLIVHGKEPGGLDFLGVRRERSRDTLFIATHEPYANEQIPEIYHVAELTRSESAVLVRIDAVGFTDYVAVAFRDEQRRHTLSARHDPNVKISFTDYAYLRTQPDAVPVARGNIHGFRLPGAATSLILNQELVHHLTHETPGYMQYGELNAPPDPPPYSDPDFPLPVITLPNPLSLARNDLKQVNFIVHNPFETELHGMLEVELVETPEGISAPAPRPVYAALPPGGNFPVSMEIRARQAVPGFYKAAYRLNYYLQNGVRWQKVQTGLETLELTVDSILRSVYNPPEATYQVYSPKYNAGFRMFDGLFISLKDHNGAEYLHDRPLFRLANEERELLFEDTEHAYVWAQGNPAYILAQAYDRVRWRAQFFHDRVMFSLDKDWTQFETGYVTLPAHLLERGGELRDMAIAEGNKAAALEFPFPQQQYSLCVQLLPPQPLGVNAEGDYTFPVSPGENHRWSAGLCDPGSLRAWMWDN